MSRRLRRHSGLRLCALPVLWFSLVVPAMAVGNEARNLSFEELPPAGMNHPPGWNFLQHAGDPSFEFALDDKVAKDGKRSLRIKRTGTQHFGSASQIVKADSLRGKRVRLSGHLRLADVQAFTAGAFGEKSGAALMLRIDGSGAILFLDDMRDRALRGTLPWMKVSLEADVPLEAETLEFGALLSGTGTLWLDAAKLEVALPPKPKGNIP